MLFFFQAEDGIRDLVRSRGLGDVYKRQAQINDLSRDHRVVWFDNRGIGASEHAPTRYSVALSLIHI